MFTCFAFSVVFSPLYACFRDGVGLRLWYSIAWHGVVCGMACLDDLSFLSMGGRDILSIVLVECLISCIIFLLSPEGDVTVASSL